MALRKAFHGVVGGEEDDARGKRHFLLGLLDENNAEHAASGVHPSLHYIRR